MLPLPNMRRDLEVSLEEAVIDYAHKRGWWEGKFVCPGQVGVPDRIFIRRGRVIFIELKKLGEKPKPKQLSKHAEMRKYGAEVFWTDNLEEAMRILK